MVIYRACVKYMRFICSALPTSYTYRTIDSKVFNAEQYLKDNSYCKFKTTKDTIVK